jgi:hypothetical protein
MKIRPVGTELFHVDGVMTKLKVTFRNFANAPNNTGPKYTVRQNIWSLHNHCM